MLYVIFYYVIWHSIINSKLFNSTNVLNSSKEIWNDYQMSFHFPHHHPTPLALLLHPSEFFEDIICRSIPVTHGIITGYHFTFDINNFLDACPEDFPCNNIKINFGIVIIGIYLKPHPGCHQKAPVWEFHFLEDNRHNKS